MSEERMPTIKLYIYNIVLSQQAPIYKTLLHNKIALEILLYPYQ